jgi:hypothetical protein
MIAFNISHTEVITYKPYTTYPAILTGSFSIINKNALISMPDLRAEASKTTPHEAMEFISFFEISK